MTNETKKIGQRMASALAEVYAQDWSGDKVFPKMNFKYISKTKIYQQLAPIFLRNGILLNIHEGQPVTLPALEHKATHYMVDVTMEFLNADDVTDKIVSNAWGEGTDNGGFGVGIATAYGVRSILLNQLLIADGIELEGMPEATVYRPLTKAEAQEVTSAVLSKAIPQKPAEAPATVPKTDDKPKEVTQAVQPFEGPKSASATAPSGLSKVMQIAFQNACKDLDTLNAEGKFTPDEWRTLSEARDAVKDKDTYSMFIGMKRTAIEMLAKK